ncbi:MAG: subclass B3 metallo-beta-lactamase [Bryobacteraceae bacterium]|jgi:metallo-beta-lactamase class B
MRKHIILISAVAGLVAAQRNPSQPLSPAQAMANELFRKAVGTPEQMNTAFPPYKVIGNVYYVGPESLGSYLITTPEGHILINSDFERTVPIIRESVEKLGFKFTDIKILLGSHAHGDHMQGDAMVKEMTGAKVMVMEEDVVELMKMTPGGKPHPLDRILHDGDQVKLGGMTLTAHLTPGHSKGCTTWTFPVQDGGKTYQVLILGSVGVNPGFVLVNNKDYPQIESDYRHSFEVLRATHYDVFLASHPAFYNMTEKYAKLGKGGPNPFIDPDGVKAHVAEEEKVLNAVVAEQKAAAAH